MSTQKNVSIETVSHTYSSEHGCYIKTSKCIFPEYISIMTQIYSSEHEDDYELLGLTFAMVQQNI
jgi:hypothetical protein